MLKQLGATREDVPRAAAQRGQGTSRRVSTGPFWQRRGWRSEN